MICNLRFMVAIPWAMADNAEAMAHALVAPRDLPSNAEATDHALDPLHPHVVAMAAAQVSLMSMVAPATVAPPWAAPEAAMAALPAAAPAVTEDGEKTNKMMKPTDKIVNAINKMV